MTSGRAAPGGLPAKIGFGDTVISAAKKVHFAHPASRDLINHGSICKIQQNKPDFAADIIIVNIIKINPYEAQKVHI